MDSRRKPFLLFYHLLSVCCSLLLCANKRLFSKCSAAGLELACDILSKGCGGNLQTTIMGFSLLSFKVVQLRVVVRFSFPGKLWEQKERGMASILYVVFLLVCAIHSFYYYSDACCIFG